MNASLNYYRHLPPTQVEQLDDVHRTQMADYLERYGQSEMARSRICKLQQNVSEVEQFWVRIIFWLLLGLIGALLYSGTAQIITLPLPSWMRTLATPILGAVLALVGEDRAKRFFTSLRLWCSRRGVERRLQFLSSKAHNSLDVGFYQSQLSLLRRVEHKTPSFLDGILALLMITIESVAVYYWVLLVEGPMLAFLAAAIPVVIILLIAAALSEHIDLPQETTKIVREYQAYITKPIHFAESMTAVL